MSTLSPATLSSLPPGVGTPGYLDRAPRVGIAHIGVGNFHRSHQAMYVDRLLSAHPDAPWAICGVGVREQDRPLARAMEAQGGLYSLSLFHNDGNVESRVIGALREFILVPDAPSAAVQRLLDPAIRIVSLTITESGYVEDPANGRTASGDAAVVADAADGFSAPTSAFGLLVAALRGRRDAGIAPFTVLCCDNIQHNGSVARASTVATAPAQRRARGVDRLVRLIPEHDGGPDHAPAHGGTVRDRRRDAGRARRGRRRRGTLRAVGAGGRLPRWAA